MSEDNIAGIPTIELQNRYGVVRSVIYMRMNALHIKPIRTGHKSCITDVQLQLMDDLDAHLKNGGKTTEFVHQCIADGKIFFHSKSVQKTPDQMSPEIGFEANGQEKITDLQATKGEQMQSHDIQEVRERAQQRAFAKAVAEETLTLIYEATEDFTIPGLKEQLEQHRVACRQVREKWTADHNINDFLSKSLALLMRATDTNGSTCPNYSNSQSTT